MYFLFIYIMYIIFNVSFATVDNIFAYFTTVFIILLLNLIVLIKCNSLFISLNHSLFLKNFFGSTFTLISFWKFTITAFLKYTPQPLKWKPLFKKSSYFGIFRSNQNQWLNK